MERVASRKGSVTQVLAGIDLDTVNLKVASMYHSFRLIRVASLSRTCHQSNPVVGETVNGTPRNFPDPATLIQSAYDNSLAPLRAKNANCLARHSS